MRCHVPLGGLGVVAPPVRGSDRWTWGWRLLAAFGRTSSGRQARDQTLRRPTRTAEGDVTSRGAPCGAYGNARRSVVYSFCMILAYHAKILSSIRCDVWLFS
jgi:hypothetical protein